MPRMTDEERLKHNREEASRFNPTLQRVLRVYYNETKDEEFMDYMQGMVDAYMMHECKLGRLPTRR